MGIGEAFARELVRRGAKVILVARSEAKLKALAAELGPQAHIVVADLAAPGAAQRVFDAVKAQELEVDVLINNAGFGLYGNFSALPLATQREVIDLNISALVELTYLFLPGIEQRQGGFIQLASIAAYFPVPYMAVYAATKAFVLSFSEALWAEYRSRGVRVLALSPGPTETPFFDRAGDKGPPGKARPEEVVRRGLAAFEAGHASVVQGVVNNFVTFASRLLRREFVVKVGTYVTRPKNPALLMGKL